MIKQNIKKLQQLLFSGKYFVHSLSGVDEVSTKSTVLHWVVSRKQCFFFRYDLSDVQAKLRASVLYHQVKVRSPFKCFGHWAHIENDTALVWFWNADLVSDAQQAFFSGGGRPAGISEVPESAFTDPIAQGFGLYQCADGFLAQFWRDSALVEERCWAGEPTREQWSNFSKACGEQVVSPPASVKLNCERVWPQSQALIDTLLRYERPVLIAAVGVFIFCLVYQLGGMVRQSVQGLLVDSRIEVADAAAQEVVTVRERAYQTLVQGRALSKLQGGGQLWLMLRVSELLPSSAGEVLLWSYNQASLELLVVDSAPDLADYVERLEADAHFEQVRVEPASRGQQVKISLEVMQ